MLFIQQEPTPDMSPETLEALSQLMLAQAQEIFTYKAVHDNMKDVIVAKLAAQTEELFTDTLKLFQKEIFRAFWDKEWIPLISSKQLAYRGISEYFQSLVCKNNKCIGEEIARLEDAVEMFKLAQTKSNRLTFYQEYHEKSMRNLVEAKKDNDFIYHEKIPEITTLPNISKATVAKLTPLPEKFSSNFQDLFIDLLPIAVHRATLHFESQKSELVNSEIAKLRNLRQILNGTLASLNLPAAIEDVSGTEVPHSLIEKAVFVNQAGGIINLEKTMNELPELLQRNKDILDEAERILMDEKTADDNLRSQFQERWKRVSSEKLTEQFKINIKKYQGIITNAINADKVVREKFEAHREAVHLLSIEPKELVQIIPIGSAVQESETVMELRKLMNEVDVLKKEQDIIEQELQFVSMDIPAKFLSAFTRDGIVNEKALISEVLNLYFIPLQKRIEDCTFKQEKLTELIQVKHADFSKEQKNCGSAREQMLCKLAAAYNAFKEIRNNLQEGVKFYNDLTQLLIIFQNKVSDFCFARKTEKEELLKDLTNSFSQQMNLNTINIPSHYSDVQPQQGNSQIPMHLPYPLQNQGTMPLPFGSAQLASYPHFVTTPLPSTFNPYATIQYPSQGGHIDQQFQPMPYNQISTFPRHGHNTDQRNFQN
ncbi:programmed cell death 6-interacting protein-like isoform X2 [Copidosoma floridanum]|nr:programmed cell death 6-interacting protein-like isoform X2 [Copidosoma floridanum]